MFQSYHNYTPDDQAVWRVLFERQMAVLPGKASQDYLDGIDQVGFVADHIPDFERELNPRLQRLTNWRVSAVPGLISNRDFFELMANRICFTIRSGTYRCCRIRPSAIFWRL
jgi:phenylalanine-4-hydroxylase